MSDIEIRQEKPAYVTFERRPVQDVAASEREGRYIAKDVDYVKITPAYTKDVMIHKVSDWFPKLENDVRNERIPAMWVDHYRKHYAAFQNGQELPLEGTPIRGWGVLSPAQQETLIRCTILTVEDLAGVNDDGIRRIGMGGVDLKNKAIAFLKSAKDTGSLVLENARLRAQLDVAEKNVEGLSKSVEELSAVVERLDRMSVPRETPPPPVEIKKNELIDVDEAPPRRGPGRPRKS